MLLQGSEGGEPFSLHGLPADSRVDPGRIIA